MNHQIFINRTNLTKPSKMPLPMLKKCCGCLALDTGCIVLSIGSTLCCIANMAFSSMKLRVHETREPEDNMISMSMVMFSTLSAISDIIVVFGIWRRRPGFLQLSILFNSVFILCIFLVAVVNCIFSQELRPFLENAGNITLVVVLLTAGAAYSLYYLMVVNSMYRKMKSNYSDSALPV